MSQGFEAENFQREWSDGISRELAEKGMLPSTKISLKTQFFGLPDKLDFMEPMKKYCEQAAQYLFSNLRGIINYNIEWTIIKAGDNFLKSCDKKGFIGNSYGYFARVFAENPHDKDNPISREAFSAFNGSTAYAHEWEPNSTIPPFKLVFIGVGSGALNAPFSELIGLSTTDRMNQKTGLSVLEDIQANEAMHEAVADSLMRGLLKELGVSNQANLISKASALMNSPRYFYVPNAGRFVQRNGIQAAYDLYMESPRKFLDAIKRI